MYTADEVRALVEEVLLKQGLSDAATMLSQEGWDALDADHSAYKRGEGRNYTWAEVKDQLRKDRRE